MIQMRSESWGFTAWGVGLTSAILSRFFIPAAATINPFVFWAVSITSIALIARKLCGGNPLPQYIVDADLAGKTIVVTGPAVGLGFNSAAFFAVRGATVILGARSVARNEDTAKRLRALPEAQGKELKLKTSYAYDAENLESVKKFAQNLEAYSESKIDVLLLNAGLMDFKNVLKSKHHPEIEYTTCVNSFAPLLLTEILMSKLKKESTRVVLLSSIAHKEIKDTNPENVIANFKSLWANSEKESNFTKFFMSERYFFSKMLNLYHADYLVSQGVESCSLHPGIVASGFFQDAGPILGKVINFVGPFICMKTELEGAITQIYCCLCKERLPVDDNNYNNDPKTKNLKFVNKKSHYFSDSVSHNDISLTDLGKNIFVANEVVKFSLEKLKPWI